MEESFEHRLQKFDPGVIWLDAEHRVTALNGVAAEVLGVTQGEVLGEEVLQLHPRKSREKIAWLLEASGGAGCPVTSAPPMTMMINIPDRILLIKLTRMMDAAGQAGGYCLVFFDVTDATSGGRPAPDGRLRQLRKLPVSRQQEVMLLDLDEVVHLRAGGHYTDVFTPGERYLCNLSLADLEARLDPQRFLRVHRSYIVNVGYASALARRDERYVLTLADRHGSEVPISRSQVPRVKDVFGLA